MRKLTLLMILTVFLFGCDKKDKADGAVALSGTPEVVPGVYRTDEVVQNDYRDYNAKETIYSELHLKGKDEGDSAVYIAFRNGKELSRRTGVFAAKHHGFLLSRPNDEKPTRHAVVDVTPTSFKMKVGSQGFEFKKID